MPPPSFQVRKYPRPRYVTVICGSLFVYAAAGFLVACWLVSAPAGSGAFDDFPAWIRRSSFVAPALLAVSGAFMLRGANWARILFYIACAPAMLAIRVAVRMHGPDPLPAVAGLAGSFLLVVIYGVLLGMERANYFFTGRESFLKSDSDRSWGGRRGSGREHTHGGFDY